MEFICVILNEVFLLIKTFLVQHVEFVYVTINIQYGVISTFFMWFFVPRITIGLVEIDDPLKRREL